MTEIPGYRIVRELGRGGMATVYLAVQESLGRDVALKLLAPELAQDPVASERFMREARMAARLVHRHIVGVHDVGKHGDQPYLSMEYLAGGKLGGQALPPIVALQAVRDIALALDHAHAKGVVHRDVKPENILLRDDTSYALSDFGIARSAGDGPRMTEQGMTVGTPQYMSPEQVQGQDVDGRSDIYSLGVVLFQLLTGEQPYQGTDGWNIGMQHISAPCPQLPAALGRYQPLLTNMMAKMPRDRPQSGAEVAQRVEALMALATPVATQVQDTPASAVPRARPARAWLLAPLLAAVAIGAWLFLPRPQPTPQEAPKTTATAPAITPASPRRSIAVLPLVNLSGDPDNEYFSDGLAETMLDMLARVPGLTVIARTSSFAFKDKAMDVRKIGQALDATHLLEGSVQRSGERLRINVQLIRASDGAHLWSQRYDRKLSDVFAVQDEVATEIVKAMQLALPDSGNRLRAGRTANVEAYQEYLRGIALLPQRRVEELRTALAHLDRAIELDPGYAIAYAEAANTLTLLSNFTSLTASEKRRREQLVTQALRLDSNLGEAYIARAVLLRRSDPVATERDFKRGLELAPGYSIGHVWYAEWLTMHQGGRSAEAVPLMRRAIAADPLQSALRVHLGVLLMALGQVPEAESIAEEIVRTHPEFPQGHNLQALVFRARGDLVGELHALDRQIAADPLSMAAREERCFALVGAGAFRQSLACAAEPERGFRPQSLLALQAAVAVNQGDRTSSAMLASRIAELQDRHVAAIMARRGGKLRDAASIYRQLMPEWFKNPIGKPNLDNEYGSVEAAFLLLAIDDRAQARRALEFGLGPIQKRAPGSGWAGGRAWAETMSLALLDRLPEACRAMEAAAATGYFHHHEWLLAEPALAVFRSQPCFGPIYARVDANAKVQIAAAQRAGLL